LAIGYQLGEIITTVTGADIDDPLGLPAQGELLSSTFENNIQDTIFHQVFRTGKIHGASKCMSTL
jgi:hypothetical protein